MATAQALSALFQTRDDEYWACASTEEMPSRIAWLDGYELRALSRDGTQILLRGAGGRGHGRGGGYGQLYLADVVTQRLRPVADWYPQELIGAAGFSPEGLRIAFQSVNRDRDRVLQTWVLELESREARCVSRRPGGFELGARVAWSPDGSMIAMDVVPAEGEGRDVPHVLVLDSSSGAEISLMYGVQLYGVPADGWEADGSLLVWDPADVPDPGVLASFAVAIRQPAAGEPLPFEEGPHNDRPIVVVELADSSVDPSLMWLKPDGTPGLRICGAPRDVIDFRTVPTVRGVSSCLAPSACGGMQRVGSPSETGEDGSCLRDELR